MHAIADFCGLAPAAEKIDTAIRSINPEPEQYLRAARTERTHGQIDSLTNHKLTGWAAWWESDEPVQVEVYTDDELFAVVTADELNPLLADKQRTRNGHCGFRLDFGDKLPQGTVVRVKVKSDLADLENSPCTV